MALNANRPGILNMSRNKDLAPALRLTTTQRAAPDSILVTLHQGPVLFSSTAAQNHADTSVNSRPLTSTMRSRTIKFSLFRLAALTPQWVPSFAAKMGRGATA
jgi:hypothetical protein